MVNSVESVLIEKLRKFQQKVLVGVRETEKNFASHCNYKTRKGTYRINYLTDEDYELLLPELATQ